MRLQPRSRLASAARRITDSLAAPRDHRARQSGNVDLILAAVLSDEELLESLNDPEGFVEFLRASMEPTTFSVDILRHGSGDSESGRRFSTLLEVLTASVPPAPLALTKRLARYVDELYANTEPFQTDLWTADVGLHAMVSSSEPKKGRLLSTVVRFRAADRALELGTGYGVSTAFMLGAQSRLGDTGRVTTIETGQTQFSHASAMLRQEFGDHVDPRHGDVTACLATLADEGQRFDVVFHDAGHHGDAFALDFRSMLPVVQPGAIVVFDDIRWQDDRFTRDEVPSHEGWLRLVASNEVQAAVEVDASVGILLLNDGTYGTARTNAVTESATFAR